MNFISFIIAYLVLLQVAFACPPPLNNWRFIGNSSHTTAELIQTSFVGSGTGWVDAVTTQGNPIKPWPRSDGSAVTTIRYCFANPISEDELSNLVFDALELWEDAIGLPGKCKGHGLQVLEFTELSSMDPYCYVQRGPFLGDWNPAVPEGTLVIRKEVDPDQQDMAGAWATVGYISQGEPDRHQVIVDTSKLSSKNAPYILAHEFGHVFGLAHEHQHPDRDDYLHFECSNVEGYDAVKQQVEARGEDTMEEVCKSRILSLKYNWKVGVFVKEPYIDEDGDRYELKGGPFDSKSIMIYHSASNMARGNDRNSVFDTPLVLWKHSGKDHPTQRSSNNCENYGENRVVSDGDYQAIKHIYPWTDRATSDKANARRKINGLSKTLRKRAG